MPWCFLILIWLRRTPVEVAIGVLTKARFAKYLQASLIIFILLVFLSFALWLFSSHPIPVFDFDDYFDISAMRQRIANTKFKGDGTCTTEAIDELRLWLLNSTSGK